MSEYDKARAEWQEAVKQFSRGNELPPLDVARQRSRRLTVAAEALAPLAVAEVDRLRAALAETTRLLSEADGELSAIAHRGTYDRDDLLQLSDRCRRAAQAYAEPGALQRPALDEEVTRAD